MPRRIKAVLRAKGGQTPRRIKAVLRAKGGQTQYENGVTNNPLGECI